MWDVTNKKFLYELSTGNNHVISVAWDANENCLVAVTDDWRMSPTVGHFREGTCISPHLSPQDYRPVKSNEDDSDDDDAPLWPNDASHDPDSFGKVCHWLTSADQ